MTRRGLLIAGALVLAGCATGPVVVAPGAGPQELEPIYSVLATRAGLTIRVNSGGCTKKADFTFFVERKGETAASVAFARKRLDICRSFAAAHADLDFSFEELGLARGALIFVLNPLNGP